MKSIVILYHKNCFDGFGAAYAAWKKFKNKADYIGVEHQAPPPKNLKNKEVYMVDFSYPLEQMKQISKQAILTVIDHHISAEASAKCGQNYLYDLNHSGAVLSWQYFHAKKSIST